MDRIASNDLLFGLCLNATIHDVLIGGCSLAAIEHEVPIVTCHLEAATMVLSSDL